MSIAHILILSCFAILLLILGIIVYLKNRTNAINRIFALLVLFVLFWLTANFFADFVRQADSVLLWNRLALIGGMFWGTTLLYFFLVFPSQEKSKALYFLFLAYLLVALGLVFLTLMSGLVISSIEILSWGSNIIGGPLYLFYNIWTVIGFLFAAFLIILRVKIAKSKERAQILYFISGAAIFTITGITFGVIYPAITGNYSYAKFSSYGIIFLFIFTAYAIIAHHLFDIRIIIKRTLVYSGLLLFILGIYGAIVFIIAQLFGQETFGKGVLSNIVAAIFIAVGFGPVKAWLSEVTDKWLFKGEYRPEEVIKHVASHLSAVVDLDEALNTMMHETTHALRIKLAATFVLRRVEDKVELKRTKSIGYTHDNPILEMTPKDPLIEYFTYQMTQKSDGHIVLTGDLEKAILHKHNHNKILLEKVVSRLKALKTSCAIPLKIKNELIGIFVLGEKLSGDEFSEEDLRFLDTVSHQTVTAIEKARFYEEDQLKTEFVNIASHELLTPTSAIKGYLSMILEEGMGKVDRQARGYLEKVYSSSMHLSELVQDLLNVSRIEQNRIKVEPKEMNIIEMINQVIEELSSKANEKKLKLNFSKISVKGLKNKENVFADPERTHQVLVNLIGNAIKYSEKGMVEIKVGICTNRGTQQILVEVIDSGIGIPKDDIKKLFGKFFRASNAANSSAEGNGLGLYITKSFIELMGGSIWVNSKEGKGSVFSFSLPLSKNK